MTRKLTYPLEMQNGDGWSDWIRPVSTPERDYRMACCDCGLVHDMQFAVVDDRVVFRASRNPRSTGQLRRQMIRRGEGLVRGSPAPQTADGRLRASYVSLLQRYLSLMGHIHVMTVLGTQTEVLAGLCRDVLAVSGTCPVDELARKVGYVQGVMSAYDVVSYTTEEEFILRALSEERTTGDETSVKLATGD